MLALLLAGAGGATAARFLYRPQPVAQVQPRSTPTPAPTAAPAPAATPTHASAAPVAAPPPNPAPPVHHQGDTNGLLVQYWYCEADATPAGYDAATAAQADAAIQAKGGQPSVFCDHALKTGPDPADPRDNIWRVPEPNAPPLPQTYRCKDVDPDVGGYVANIVATSSQTPAWEQPHADQQEFDAAWNPVAHSGMLYNPPLNQGDPCP